MAGRCIDIKCTRQTKPQYPGYIESYRSRTSLGVQWLRICLLMQGTWVCFLVQEDATYLRATKPVCYNHWACVPQLENPSPAIKRSCVLQLSPNTAKIINKYIFLKRTTDQYKNYKQLERKGDFPGGPVVKTLHPQCRKGKFNPWLGN